MPAPAHECVSLDDYRLRYASHHLDPDLTALHATHPCIAVWDDHESANDSWRDGALRHEAEQGPWPARKAAARQAFDEWLPLRESPRMYRQFGFGGLADVMMLDGRSYRDQQVLAGDYVALTSPRRSMLGAEQEAWLYDRLRRSSQRAGTAWRLLGQQVIFAPFVPQVGSALEVDNWEGYPAARTRFFDCVERDRIADVAVLTGDIHSSWALDLPRSPLSGYDSTTGRGSLAVEIITPAVTSPPFFSRAGARERAEAVSQRLTAHAIHGRRPPRIRDARHHARAAARRVVSRAHHHRAHRRRVESGELRLRAGLAARLVEAGL